MPLPNAPTQRPTPRSNPKADNELMIKAILCAAIGLGILISPYFITSPGMQNIVAKSTLVGWFALVLGIGFAIVWGRRKLAQRNRG